MYNVSARYSCKRKRMSEMDKRKSARYGYIVKGTTGVCYQWNLWQVSGRLFRVCPYYPILERNSVTANLKYKVAQIAFSVRWDLTRRARSIQQRVPRVSMISYSNARNISMYTARLQFAGYGQNFVSSLRSRREF